MLYVHWLVGQGPAVLHIDPEALLALFFNMFVHPATSAFVDVSFVFVGDQGSVAVFFSRGLVMDHQELCNLGFEMACRWWQDRLRAALESAMEKPCVLVHGLARSWTDRSCKRKSECFLRCNVFQRVIGP